MTAPISIAIVPVAPIATTDPSAERLTEDPDSSRSASPSISLPI